MKGNKMPAREIKKHMLVHTSGGWLYVDKDGNYAVPIGHEHHLPIHQQDDALEQMRRALELNASRRSNESR